MRAYLKYSWFCWVMLWLCDMTAAAVISSLLMWCFGLVRVEEGAMLILWCGERIVLNGKNSSQRSAGSAYVLYPQGRR